MSTPIMIDLTLSSGSIYTFIINGNVAFSDQCFINGIHNNDGWVVKESREDIKKKILEAIERNKKGY